MTVALVQRDQPTLVYRDQSTAFDFEHLFPASFIDQITIYRGKKNNLSCVSTHMRIIVGVDVKRVRVHMILN